MKIYQNLIRALVLPAMLMAFFAAAATTAIADDHVFVVIRVAAWRADAETSSEKPQEVRFYISDVIKLPNDPYLQRKARDSASDYLTKTVIEPLKAKGIEHAVFYDDSVKINDGYILAGLSRAEAEERRAKIVEGYKEQWGNIYTFVWAYGQNTVGLDISKPTLFYHNPEVPIYTPKGDTPAKEAPKKGKGKN